MELPHLGQNCALQECNQLDFLPIKCDACSSVFCAAHYRYEAHNCVSASNRNNQVPVCPLCSKPVPSKRGELPDVAVSQHIDQLCERNENIRPSQRIKNKPNSSRQVCSYKACKHKDVINLQCQDCRQTYCIKHRHPTDHMCTKSNLGSNFNDNWQSLKDTCSSSAASGLEKFKSKAQQMSKSGQAAINRLASTSSRMLPGTSSSNNPVENARRLQGSLTEEEALYVAMAESKKQSQSQSSLIIPHSSSHEDEDLALARAIHESQMENMNRNTPTGRRNNNNKNNCYLI